MIVEIILAIENSFQYLMNLRKLLTLGDTGTFLFENLSICYYLFNQTRYSGKI